MITVKQILEDKQGKVLTVEPEDDLYHALKIMADNNIGALIVVKNDKVVGIFSERDFVRNAARKGNITKYLTVSHLMSIFEHYVRPEQTIDDCMAMMTKNRTRHLPVLDGGTLVGIVSIGDVLKHTIEEKEFKIKNLENYISGSL
jgi:Predicted signal-transduction protein containing cAMP-binding and CBS domains